jgi:C-terminal binding protein
MLGVDRVDSLNELLEMADVISINTPLTDEIRGMVNVDFISKMKYGAALINTDRGEILENIDNFIEPLKSGDITGLALDVLPEELPKNLGLIASWKSRKRWLDGKLIINPHTSYYSKDSFKEMRVKASENVKRFIEGKTPFNIITTS